MEDLDFRILFNHEEDKIEAEKILDESGDDYDWDSGDRMMIGKSGLSTLNQNKIDYDIVAGYVDFGIPEEMEEAIREEMRDYLEYKGYEPTEEQLNELIENYLECCWPEEEVPDDAVDCEIIQEYLKRSDFVTELPMVGEKTDIED